MAPLSKESETALGSNPQASPAPAAKPPDPTRPQPVALETPVTINGAHTASGSGKREPFSESTSTVLLFAHGAVVRMATPLSPGQLVFLTNDKTKKEIVCQVVKSKAGGSCTYVELKFTEPAPAFWGIRTQATTDGPVTGSPTAPKDISTAPLVAPKPEIEKPLAPATVAVPPTSTVVPPPAVLPPPSFPATPPPPPPSTNTAPEGMPSLTNALLQAAPKSIPPAEQPPESKPPVATFKDFSKEIDALFGVPMSPSAAHPPASAVQDTAAKETSTASTQELKLHAAEVQAKLGAMLFTETPEHSAPTEPALPTTVSSNETASSSPDGLAAKLLEFAQEKPKPFVTPEAEVKPEPTSSLVATKPVVPTLPSDDEVKIPAWLAPLSQNPELPVSELAGSSASSPTLESSSDTEDLAGVHGDAARRSQASVFGGQLLGEAAEAAPASRRSSGLLLTLAAAAILLVAAAAWYFLYGPGAGTNASTHPTHTTSSVEQPKPAETQPIEQVRVPESTPAVGNVSQAPTDSLMASPLPSKAASVDSSPAVFKSAPERRPVAGNTPTKQLAPMEPPNKPTLGDVHLAAPVVNRDSNHDSTDAEPSIETSTPNSDAAAAFTRGKAPVAPIPVGGDVKPAQLIKSVPPEYPQLAKTQHVSGNVQIDALVDASGNVVEVQAISGPQLLHRAALDAVKKWKYAPATLNGEPTSMHLTVVVQFRAQ